MDADVDWANYFFNTPLQEGVGAARAKVAQLQAMQARNQKDAVFAKQVFPPHLSFKPWKGAKCMREDKVLKSRCCLEVVADLTLSFFLCPQTSEDG